MKLTSRCSKFDRRLVAITVVVAICIATSLRAQSAECAPLFTASSKLYEKPFHVYMIDTAQTDAQLNGGKPRVSESIWTGAAVYVLVRMKWRKSPVDVAEMRKMATDNPSQAKATCSHVRDESVNGEPAAVWRIQSVSEFDKRDTDEWISRSRGVVLKSDVHDDVGGAFGKSHTVSRYEYTNVQAPAGVQ